MNFEQQILCGECNENLSDLSYLCKTCGSHKKNIVLNFEDEFDIKACIKGEKKNPSLKSKDKMRQSFINGATQSANGEWVEKTRILDKDNDYYFEEIKNSQGVILHYCEEKLTEHQGHGTAKFKKSNQ